MLGKHTLKAGEKTELKVTFATKGAPGPFEKIVTIDVDIPEPQQIEAVMTGTVKEAPGAKLTVSPRKLDVGSMKQGVSKKLKLTLSNTGELPLAVKKIFLKGGSTMYFDGAKQGDAIVAAGKTQSMEIEYTPSKPGALKDVILIESNARNAPKGGVAIMVTGKSEE
ncbi:DUF1573 domain-containing protein [Geobacter sp. FeAm09]|uniref:choice-of-anchor D domain-containing protein n=1 Tax=Geobacter sp. FeAm09 TaxID=2597769 RepID=UPI0011ECDE60|nr:choice-of-anchor D domain-containing protein [Geobacter sp. FeAm09]QEM69480.1 DUF1573 domain-containing protein [Geobacter sp. FeAm09]